MRSQHTILIAILVSCIFLYTTALADQVTFDGGTLGTVFGQPVGTPVGSLLFTEDGTDVTITTLVSNGNQSYNFCKIEDSIGPPANFHQNNIMSLQAVGLIFDFVGQGDVRFEYLHTGGVVNLQVNGYGVVLEDQTIPAMAGFLAPGITMSATSTVVPGGYKGTVTITGPVQTLRIGAGELYLDDVVGGGEPEPDSCDLQVSHQSLVVGNAWGSNSGNSESDVMFHEDGIPVSCEQFHISGSATTFGNCGITNAPVQNFGFDKVMRCNDIGNQYDIAALGIATAMVSFEFLNDGSLVNLQVNEETIYIDLFENMPQNIASGVNMTVTSYSAGSGTGGLIVLNGNVETLLVGGRVLYLDNLCVTQDLTSAVGNQILPGDLQLDSIFPNPFNPSTTISFTTKSSGNVQLTLFDVAGHMVARLVDENLAAGHHNVTWTGKNSTGQKAPAGVFFVELRHGQSVVTKKIMMVK